LIRACKSICSIGKEVIGSKVGMEMVLGMAAAAIRRQMQIHLTITIDNVHPEHQKHINHNGTRNGKMTGKTHKHYLLYCYIFNIYYMID